jgi:hypothetical protein
MKNMLFALFMIVAYVMISNWLGGEPRLLFNNRDLRVLRRRK